MPQLSISLLGSFQVTQDGQAITSFETDLARALLSYLSMHAGTSFSRETLAALFWPDSPADEALHALRQTLNRLRAAIGDHDRENDYLLVSRRALEFNSQSDFWLDVTAFNDLLASTRQHAHRRLETCRSCNQQLLQANRLWRSDFLDTLNVNSSPFQEWLTINRERLRIQAIETFTHLANHYEHYGDEEHARFFAWRQLELEPWREEAHRQLMRLMAANGQRSTALTQYRNCQSILTKEFGIEPAAETTALYEQIRTDKIETPKTLLTNLPVYLSTFVGRERELRQITEYLQQRDCRLLTLVGLGGMGKTRLAIQVAMQEAAGYRDGVVFVPLSALDSANQVLTALAQALRFAISSQQDLSVQLRNYLKQKELLIILDSFEHVLDAAGQISDLLKHAQNVQALITARERLHVQGEWVYAIGGLGIPQNGDTEVADDSAIQLFTQVTQRVQPQFNGDLPTIKQICQLLDGMPLAIEMAASWRRVLSCAEIVQEIEQDLGFLYAEMRDMPEHHRSLEAVFSSSWAMLTSNERDVLCRLSVFRGGFGRAAATDIAGAHTRQLAALTDKSWLRQEKHEANHTPRYGLHDLVQRYTADQLAQQPDLVTLVRDQHSHHYATWLHQYLPMLKGNEQRKALKELGAETENLRVAWERMISRKMTAEIDLAWESLFLFYDLQGWLQEGENAFGQLAREFAEEQSPEGKILFGRALFCQGWFVALLGRTEIAKTLLKQSVVLLRNSEQHHALALALNYLGVVLLQFCAFAEARNLCEESLTLFQEFGDAYHEAMALNTLGLIAYRQENYTESEQYLRAGLELARAEKLLGREAESLHRLGATLEDATEALLCSEQALARYREVGNVRGESTILLNLGEHLREQGDYARARAYLDQALQVKRQIGDRQGETAAFRFLGRLMTDQNQCVLAQAYYDQALAIAHEIGNPWSASMILQNLGELEIQQGDWAGARSSIENALELVQKGGPKGEQGFLLAHLGDILLWQGDFVKARDYLEQALKICRETACQRGLRLALNDLALLFHYSGDQKMAQSYSQQALPLAEKLGPREHASVLMCLGHTLRDTGNWDQARDIYQQAFELYHRLDKPHLSIEARACLASTALARGDIVQAQAHVGDVLAYLSTVPLDGAQDPIQIYLACYRILKVSGDPRCGEILSAGYADLQKRLQSVNEELRDLYLQNIPSHRELLAEWAAVQG